MFKTQEQIEEVSVRTGVSPELIRKLSIMMSRVKLAQKDLRMLDDKSYLSDIIKDGIKENIKEAMDYFENDFLQCKLW